MCTYSIYARALTVIQNKGNRFRLPLKDFIICIANVFSMRKALT